MKRIFLSLAAVFAFGIASAQTEPKTVKPMQPEPPKTTDVKDKAKEDAEIQNDVNKDPEDAIVPRKDELKTRDHVKSTPDPKTVKDTVATKKKMRKSKKRS
ncbi:hypothetical protein HYN59_08555 [Flavobacterium album]|uniref:Uncharacterized protein n=1 Tax=Flavobacterium album TaxID=2175091 RepID=A0A2S1QXN2_9FLAO|nr:hypothetical protein [Flavobacterium album]AWH85170.1 hypothetical protein HYN59_08555 [Flavobacterium album]